MTKLAGAVVDLDVAGLGGLRNAGDEERLATWRDRVLDGLGLGRRCAAGGRDTAAEGDAVHVDAEARVDLEGLRDRRLTAERDLDVLRTATAVELWVAEAGEGALVGVVDDVNLGGERE